jgi:hypothetical protein
MTVPEIIIQMGHDKREDFWFILEEQLYTPFYNNMMKCNQLFHMLRVLHFWDNRNQPDKTDVNYDRLWNIRSVFERLSVTHIIFYNPSEHLPVE